jgi:hypothetical protein
MATEHEMLVAASINLENALAGFGVRENVELALAVLNSISGY